MELSHYGTVQGWVLCAGWAEGKVLEASLGWPAGHPGLLSVLSWPPGPCEDRNKA